MKPFDRLTEYLAQIERRLRVLTLTRGAAAIAAAALVFTVIAVVIANYFAFSGPSLVASRLLLFVALGFALGLGLLVPILRLNRRSAARRAEQKFPAFEERLLTFTERVRENPNDPFLDLLAADSLEMAQQADPQHVAARRWILSFASAAVGSLLVLLWLGTSGPGFLGYGTSLLWGGVPKGQNRPFYDIQVEPGDRTVRKQSDQLINANLVGFRAQRVRVMAKYASSSKWEQADMRPQADGSGYELLLAGIPESLSYYVEAAGVRSKEYHLRVVDLPAIKRIRVTYKFPAWTGMADAVEDPGGDLRAVEGTLAEVAVETDRPLANGSLVLDDGTKISLQEGAGTLHIGRVPIQKDGIYHVAAVELGENVRLSEDYFIEARKDKPPTIRITRPGRDARVSPIEEVTVAVEAADDFGLRTATLHYSVNAGPEQTVSLPAKGRKESVGSTTLYLEDFKLSPGDVVSMYATAKDARSVARTDMFFVEAQPFQREYSQSQQAGGGGGGGMGDDGRISQRQKEIIAATWNQIKDTSGDKAAAGENARFLSDVQSKLRDQARSLVNRMRSRQLAGANDEFKSFVEDMQKAVEAMGPATEKLRGQQWQPALQPEQKALQHLLRAEATFREIQVAFGSRGGGGGGNMGRDLEGLFDLELDTEKNQYETGQQSASADQRQREIDEALQKLEQLARRQQELAEQQRRNQQMTQQRWQQEMLRREAEQLQRRMEQLNREGSSSQMQQGQQSGRQQSGRQQAGGNASSSQLQQAIERLSQATRDMQQAGSSQGAGSPQREAESRRAAERLKEARELLSGMRQQQAENQLDDMVRKADQLAAQQQSFGNRMRQAFGTPGQPGHPEQRAGANREQAQQLAAEKEQMSEDLRKLESEMQKAMRELAATQRDAAGKLREALGNMQQEELGLRMRWSAQMIRRGLGNYAVMREAVVTQGLGNLSQQVREAQQALGAGRPTGEQKNIEQALAQAEKLRQQMEQVARGLRDGKGARNGDRNAAGQPGQQGQEPGQQSGQKQGSQGQSSGQGQDGQGQRGQGQSGQEPQGQLRAQRGGGWNSGSYGAVNRGDWLPAPGTVPLQGTDREALERMYRDGVRDLSRLENALEGDQELQRDVQDLVREMQRLDPRSFPGNPEMIERLYGQVLTGIEQVELQLRRRLDDQQAGNVRSTAGQPVPPGYADAVADYFRRLSRGK